jgi:catechol 2,3-dioxygenase-like lactoylglutathione lyase family enzyme
MPRPLITVIAAALLLVFASSKPNLAQNPTPAPKTQGRVLGIGGVFFKAADQARTREWYAKNLGLVDKGAGAMLPWRELDDAQKEHVTVWTAFPSNTTYFAPSQATFMINYIVDDLDAMLARLQAEGVKIDPKRMNASYGRFAWIYDPDGNKIELWEPAKAAAR